MKLPRTGREWYVQKITTDPPVATWSASFDGGDTFVAGEQDGTDASLFRWLVHGPDFPADAEPSTEILTDVTPFLKTTDHPEVLIRRGTRITLSAGEGIGQTGLFEVEDLNGFPGAPFSAAIVASVGEQIRNLSGWHIAPTRTETLVLDSPGDRVLMLPSLYVVDVSAVRDVSGDTTKPITDYRWSEDGMLSRRGGYWPMGFRAIEVDITHGYDSCPPDLFPVAADFSRRRVAQESIGGRSVTYVSTDEGNRLDSTLSAYRIGPRL